MRSSLASRYRSPLGPDDEARSRAECREAWLQHGILVVRVEDINVGWAEREMLRNVGQQLYGPRPKEAMNGQH